MSNIQVNFGDILPETSKSSAYWDMGVDSQLKWPLLFSPNVNWDGTSLAPTPQSNASSHGGQTYMKPVRISIDFKVICFPNDRLW